MSRFEEIYLRIINEMNSISNVEPEFIDYNNIVKVIIDYSSFIKVMKVKIMNHY